MELDRRAFLLLLAGAAQPAIRVGALVPREHASLWRGLRFGAAEASHTATLLGRKFQLVERAADVTIRGPVVTITAGGKTYRLSPDERGKIAWHPRLTRYGAGELNERFRRDTGQAMDEAAWLGWVAVKIAAESALRRRDLGSVRVDGHKGVPLRFDANRNLVQPLYEP